METTKKVWFCMDRHGCKPVKVEVPTDRDVYDVLKIAKPELSLHLPLDRVTVMFNGEEVPRDALLNAV